MADKKISALTGATTPLAGTEVLPIVQGGATVNVSVANLTAGRAVAMAGGSFTDNITQSTAAKGFNFTANTPAAGMTSQLLNWYEEGTFTPTFVSLIVTGSPIYSGQYTRIGRIVYFKVTINANGGTTSSTGGTTYLSNLPYSSNGLAVCEASNSDAANYGTGLVSATFVSPPSWVATNRNVVITGSYTV